MADLLIQNIANDFNSIGDIICVYPDGACKEEVAPNSVYKIEHRPELSVEDAEKLIKHIENTTAA
jgi:hypothetical protein